MADECVAKHYRSPAKVLCLALMVFGWAHVGRALDPGLPPGGNFDLSNWYLQLPTSNNILTGASGSVDSASASQLVSGFTNEYFYTGPDGAMTFWVPDNGAHTGGSSNPRSELRELLNTNSGSLNWTLYGTHVLTAQLKVLRVSSDSQKVCIGQIHEPNTLPDGVTPSANNEEMIMFDLGNQKIYANINLDGNTNSSFSMVFTNGPGVATNTTVNYVMSVVNGLLTISVNNVTNSWNLFSGTNYQGHYATNWDLGSSNTVYFKAGAYNQTLNTCNCSNDGAQVAFYVLTAFHSATITNQPANFVSGLGGSATFSVGAIGNGPLSYQWQNGTNNLAGATNATLTLTNLSSTNLGNYSVVVSDSTSGFSSVTSSVVTLTGTNFPPAITSQPVSQSVFAGTNVTFTVGEAGTTPMTNHWWFNTNTSLPWSTASSITISNVQTTNFGIYFVVVNNKYGAVTSAIATLSVSAPPTITNQPVSQRVSAGTNVSFTVGASGTPSLYYNWWFNSTNKLAGATNAAFSITNVSTTNSGDYTVVITNNFGSVTSAVASLAVVVTATFTNAGGTNWICPAGVSAVQVECWGGGGAGGGATKIVNANAWGGGGAGGAYAKKTSIAVTAGNSYAYSIGAGGVSLVVSNAVVNGGDTYFIDASTVLAKGGAGGVTISNPPTGTGGAGGVGSSVGCIGDVSYAGGSGSAGYNTAGGGGGGGANDSSAGGSATAGSYVGGSGGAYTFTAGGAGGYGANAPANGTNGFAPGGGGGGARCTSGGPKTGGTGGVGRVILTYTVNDCSAATAATPIGNGGGTGGLTICPGQTITLTEIPTAGTAPFSFAWKKVGSPTVLGITSNLLVSAPVNGDQYTCDVTSACGNGTATSPAATLSVAGPGVTLSASNQSVYRTMSVAVTATVSGSATGGVWTATGTGTFSSTNSLTTIYTPSAADAGATVNLTFTTQGGSCSPATATDAVTFNLAANPAKVVILKADDFRGTNSSAYQTAWNSLLQTSRALGVKVGIGVICTNNLDPAYAVAQPTSYQATTNWMRAQEAAGDVEFWNHAWIHTYWTNLSGQTIYEYSGSGLAAEQFFMANSQAALANALGHAVSAFGPAYNQVDTNAATVINATTALHLLFASSPATIRSYGLNSSVAAVKIISESDGTGLPNSTNFIAAYPGGPTGPVALQFHPPYFINTNGTNSLLEFQKIVQYLLTNGYSILLPSEYVATLPTITNQPASQFVLTGSNATFTVGAIGDPALAYQWQLNGTNRAGATATTLIISNVQSANMGAYTVIVTNFSGAVTSTVASLGIKVPPVFSAKSALTFSPTLQLNFTGTPLASYFVQFKTNLTDPVWSTIGSQTADSNGVCTFVDSAATNYQRRFYRLMAQ